MRRIALPLLLVIGLCSLSGCIISTQEGERTHVNAKFPEEVTFHFDTGYNRAVLYGRSAALLLIPIWAFISRKGGSNTFMIVLSVAAVAGSIALLVSGRSRVEDYRIELREDVMSIQIPSEPKREVGWNEIESIKGEGTAKDVRILDGKGQALHWATEWEDLDIELAGGRKFHVDLRPLSVEQRGTFWRAIVRKAELQGREWVAPASKR